MNDVTDEIWNRLIAYEPMTFLARGSSLRSLAHYTTFAGLKGIIESEELWFSSTATTNDYGEISRGKSILERTTIEGQALFKAVEAIKDLDPVLWEALNDNYRNRGFGDFYHTYISCWSECDLSARSHDDLTMWRGYAADGNGVAIVVDALKLGVEDSTPSEIVICPVFYESEAELTARARLAFEMFRDALGQLDKATIQANSVLIANAFGEICFYLAVTHKHPGFAKEKEWRFAWSRHRVPSDEGLRKYLRPVLLNGDLVERFCFPIKTDPAVTKVELNMRDLVQSVMIGPCDNIILKRDAVVNLLRSRGFPNAEELVTYTEIPYRSAR